jgi:septal ring factor EnvC (AmiA/AmiB activator)
LLSNAGTWQLESNYGMELPDLQRLLAELMAAHRETERHVVRMMERQSDVEATMQKVQQTLDELKSRNGEIEKLTKQVIEQNMRLSRIIEAHDYSIDDLDERNRRRGNQH